MVEAGASEVPEAEILDALDIAQQEIKKLCALQRELAEKAGKPKLEVQPPEVDPELYEQIKSSHGAALDAATQVEDKLERQEATKAVEEEVLAQYAGDPESATYAEARAKAQLAFDKLEKTIIRERIAIQKKRPDGRGTDEIRPISIEVGVSPRAHGSALFTRGQTQALSVVALGTTREEMRLDTLGLETSKRYFHHYNFPPFSVGEAGFMRGPKRRDIGHGALAERALVPMIPSQEELAAGGSLPTLDRRRAEDELGKAVYSDVPAPERELLALVHTMLRRGLVTEGELADRMRAVRSRLEAV